MNLLESGAKEGNSPVSENVFILLVIILEYFEERMPRGKLPVLTGKAKYSSRSIVNKYREGKVKRTPVRGVK